MLPRSPTRAGPGSQGGTGAAPALAIRHLPGDGDRPRLDCGPTGGPGSAGPIAGQGRAVGSCGGWNGVLGCGQAVPGRSSEQ